MVVIDEIEQQTAESGGSEPCIFGMVRRLPPARIVLVPFSLVEVESAQDDE